jgi:hypothetical protein
MWRLGMACAIAGLMISGCGGPGPSPSQQVAIFDVDEPNVGCGDRTEGIDEAIQRAQDTPDYLDCVTVTLQVDADGAIWICDPVVNAPTAPCEANRMAVENLDLDRISPTWHGGTGARWTDPIQILGRVRFR